MSPARDPFDSYIRRAALLLLLLVIFGSGFTTLLHYLEPNPYPVSLFIPPINCIINAILFVYLYQNPDRFRPIFWTSLLLTLSQLALIFWYFILQATVSAEIKLVEVFPPIASLPLVLITTMFVFARPRQVLITAAATWFLIALPVLIYLVFHPNELFTPRGLEMMFVLGPFTIVISALIPLHKGIEQKLLSLQHERAQMQRLSERDPLTQLYNRRGIENGFSDFAIASDSNIGAILFDIDRFKAINDRYGHGIGDTVLCQVAQRCQERLSKDDLFARWGGEEFLILVQRVDDNTLYRIAEELRTIVSDQPIGPVGTVTASFGVTQFCSTDSMESLLKRADEAMYLAKRQGRDRVVWQ